MRPHPYVQVQVARRPAAHAGFALASQTNAIAGVDARRDLDTDAPAALHLAGAAALPARGQRPLPFAAAPGAHHNIDELAEGGGADVAHLTRALALRSEERRVGKECKCRGGRAEYRRAW